QLAKEGGMPERFLLQVLRKLVRRGVLESTCGADGGYFLSRSPHQISLGDVVDAFENSLDVSVPALDCMLPGVRAQLVETLYSASAVARDQLRKLTIAELIANGQIANCLTNDDCSRYHEQLPTSSRTIH